MSDYDYEPDSVFQDNPDDTTVGINETDETVNESTLGDETQESYEESYEENQEQWLSPTDIARIAQVFGFGLSALTVDQVNQIRNRLGFPGIVDRDYFETAEVNVILCAFDLPANSSEEMDEQISQLKHKLYSMRSNPKHPYVPRTSPNASPIVAQLSMTPRSSSTPHLSYSDSSPSPKLYSSYGDLTPRSPRSPRSSYSDTPRSSYSDTPRSSYSDLAAVSSSSSPSVSLSRYSRSSNHPGHLVPVRSPSFGSKSPTSPSLPSSSKGEFSLDEIKTISSQLGLPSYGTRETLVRNLRAYIATVSRL